MRKVYINSIMIALGVLALAVIISIFLMQEADPLERFDSGLYKTKNNELISRFISQDAIEIDWSMLLPDSEKAVLKKFQQQQATTASEFADNILLQLEASTDKAYNAALSSTNSVEIFDDKLVSIAGFIVPIDFDENRNLRRFFVVPYYGACLHFPPPPPNQIIVAEIGEGFSEFELTQAYKLSGVLTRGLFEDPLGTSAYVLNVVAIETFYQNPDNFRQHD